MNLLAGFFVLFQRLFFARWHRSIEVFTLLVRRIRNTGDLVHDRPPDRPGELTAPSNNEALKRALLRARWSIFWERLWPALASLTTVGGLFLALSWLGLWLWLPTYGRLIGLGIFFLLAAAAFAPFLTLRAPSRMEALKRLDRNSGRPHRPATAIADELATPTADGHAMALWRAHIERALRAARTLKAECPRHDFRCAIPWRCVSLLGFWSLLHSWQRTASERTISGRLQLQGVMAPANFRVDAWVNPPTYTGKPPLILQGLRPGEPLPSTAAVTVPSGSILVIRASGIHLSVLRAADSPKLQPAHKRSLPSPRRSAASSINDTGIATVRGASSRDVSWHFSAIPDHAPVISLAKDPEGQARGALQLTYKMEDDYGVVAAQAKFRRLGPEGRSAACAASFRTARIRAGAAPSAHPQRRRADHEGLDRASLGRRQRFHDTGGTRRSRQRGAQRPVRHAIAGAAV